MQMLPRFSLVFLLTLTSVFAVAEVMLYPFDNELEELRFHSLLGELRCPKCQNQSLADSDSPIAHDLREKVYALIQDGKSDQEIRDYLINRYGEFISYRPALKGTNWLLWLGPAVLLLFSLAMAFRMVLKANALQNSQAASNELEQRHD